MSTTPSPIQGLPVFFTTEFNLRRITSTPYDGDGHYFGETNEEGIPNGYGTIVKLSQGEQIIYSGSWLNGKRHGKGMEKNGIKKYIYEGDFELDHIHGQGKLIKEEGGITKTYIATFVRDEVDGNALVMFSTGAKYTGGFKNRGRWGEGEQEYPSNDKHGRIRYKGQWMNNKHHGWGRIECINSVYEGEFFQHERHGTGTLFLSKEATHRNCIQGFFKHNQLHGPCMRYQPNAKNPNLTTVTCENYDDGQLVSSYLMSSNVSVCMIIGESVDELTGVANDMAKMSNLVAKNEQMQLFQPTNVLGGNSKEAAITKLEQFFGAKSFGGSCYENYVLYYSGHGDKLTGDWKFENGTTTISLKEVVILWLASAAHRIGGRLIIVIDACYSGAWVGSLKRQYSMGGLNCRIAIQASCKQDEESADKRLRGGQFTLTYLAAQQDPACIKQKPDIKHTQTPCYYSTCEYLTPPPKSYKAILPNFFVFDTDYWQ